VRHDYWHYFLALERDFVETTRFVDPSTANFRTHSIAYAKVLLGACSEVDVVAKVLCERIQAASNPRNIDDYRKIITAAYPKLQTFEAHLPRHILRVVPWKTWSGGTNPPWWHSYNSVKHHRHQHFDLANLENCVAALAGLFCLVLYLYQTELYALELDPWPELFSLPKEPQHIVKGGYELPDFPNPGAG
jgi:hypothetical protein